MSKKALLLMLSICCAVAILASFIASSHPDGLEWVAEKIGFMESSEGKEAISSPMPDYSVPGIKNEYLSTVIAGIVGTIIMFCIAYIAGKLIKTAKKKKM